MSRRQMEKLFISPAKYSNEKKKQAMQKEYIRICLRRIGTSIFI